VDLIPSGKCPVDIVQTSPAGIDPEQGASTFGRIQSQGLFGSLDQRLKGSCQAGSALKKPVNHHFAIACRQYPPQLSSTAITCSSEIAFGGQSRLFAARQAGEIHI
jgi:hypothetical protein